MSDATPADQELRDRLKAYLERGRIDHSILELYRRARVLAKDMRHSLVTAIHLALAVAENPDRWGVRWSTEWQPQDTWQKEATRKLNEFQKDLEAGAEPCLASDCASLLDAMAAQTTVTLDRFLTRLVSEDQWCRQHLLRTFACAEMVVDDQAWNSDQTDLQGRGVWFGSQFVSLRDLVENPALRPGPRQLRGRDDLVRRTGRALEPGNSVLLVGRPGVGKTAVIQEVARHQLRNRGRLIREAVLSRLRTSWAEGAQQLLRELTKWAKEKGRILFIDEFDTLLSIGAHMQNPTGLALELVSEIDRGLILIGTLTYAGLDRLRRDELLEPLIRRIGRVIVPPLNREEIRAIFRDALHAQGKEMDDGVLERFLALGELLLLREHQPAKGLRWIKRAAAVADTERIKETELSQAIAHETGLPRYVVASYLRGDLFALGLAKVEDLKEYLKDRIQAQDEAVDEVVNVVEERLSLQGRLLRPDRPRAVFVFMGPPGTGKTTLARRLGEYLFEELEEGELGGGGTLVYTMVGENISDLLGSRGTGGDRGKLAMDMAERAARVVVFDDFEKASDVHVLDLLLPILSEGRVQSARGEEIYFTDAIVVLTTNLKAEEGNEFGFLRNEAPCVGKAELRRKLAERYPRLEPLLDRVDRVVRFWDFGEEDLKNIAKAKVKAYNNVLGAFGYRISMSPEAVEHVAREAFRKRAGSGGAREVERELEDTVYGPARKKVMKQIAEQGCDRGNGHWVVHVTKDAERNSLCFHVKWEEEVSAAYTNSGDGIKGQVRSAQGAVADQEGNNEKEAKGAYA